LQAPALIRLVVHRSADGGLARPPQTWCPRNTLTGGNRRNLGRRRKRALPPDLPGKLRRKLLLAQTRPPRNIGHANQGAAEVERASKRAGKRREALELRTEGPLARLAIRLV